MTPSNDLPTKGDIIAGKYQIEEVLGQGGMGMVVAARHLDLRQRVAVKFLLPVALRLPGASHRFLREARAAASIRSEHVAHVLDVGKLETGSPYMVMEYLSGIDFSRLLKERGPLPVVVLVDLLLQAGEAIAEAHSLGIVHRDLKPANLFRTLRNDGSALVKVLDFGLSKMADENAGEGSLTATGVVAGSPQYMSPEQFRSLKHSDARTDIWALGVIFYEMLTGRRPFDGTTSMAICANVVADPPKPPSTYRAGIPAPIEAVILRCLEKDPNQRIQTMFELAKELAPFGSPASAVSVERISCTRSVAATPLVGTNDEGEEADYTVDSVFPRAIGMDPHPAPPATPPPAVVSTTLRASSSGPVPGPAPNVPIPDPRTAAAQTPDPITVSGSAWGTTGPLFKRPSKRWGVLGASAALVALTGIGALTVWANGLGSSAPTAPSAGTTGASIEGKETSTTPPLPTISSAPAAPGSEPVPAQAPVTGKADAGVVVAVPPVRPPKAVPVAPTAPPSARPSSTPKIAAPPPPGAPHNPLDQSN